MKSSRLLATTTAALLALASRAASADVSVDDFEDVADWTGLKSEIATVHEGKGAGRWDDQVNVTSIQKKFSPALDLSNEKHLQVWMWSAKANGAQIMVVLDSDNAGDPAGWDYYSTRIVVDWTGWKLLALRLEDFNVSRKPLGWNHINYISLNAGGWTNTPLADTALVLDDMSFATGVISGVRIEQGWQGGDFVYTYTVGLEDRLGIARDLSLAVDAAPTFPFTAAVTTPSVALVANGKGDGVVTVTVPASQITPATRLNLDRATLVVTEQGATRDAQVLSAAVPLDKREHPRTLLTKADFDRITAWAGTDAWAKAARDSMVTSAQGWPAPFLKKYAVSQWALPPEGGQWTLWYVCPKHGVHLKYTPPMTHTCPVDNEALTGFPYDQVVYAWMHSDLADAARDLGLAWQLAGDSAAALLSAQILLAYADIYATLPIHDIHGEPAASGGRALAQTLDESGWLVSMAWAYDLIADSAALTAPQRTHIEQDLLRAAMAVIARNPAGQSNWQSWHNAGTGAAAFAMDDPVGISQAMRSATDGFSYQMATSVSADGFWYEGSWGYHFYALDALMKLAEMGARAGLDPYSDKALRSMFEAPLKFAMPDGTLPMFNDSGAASLWSNARYYEAAYARYQDPTLTAFLGKATRGRDALFWGAQTLPATTPPDLPSLLFPDAGFAVLRAGAGKDASYLALKYGPHGGWHGHYDKLGHVLFARGGVLGVDPGTQSYAAPTHTTWDKVTLSHNTVVIDEKTQGEATGKLHRFASLPSLSMASTDAGEAYGAAMLLRTMILSPDYVVDRFRVSATDGAVHKMDWIHHAPGEMSTPIAVSAPAVLPTTEGYQHLQNAKAADVPADWQVSFAQKPQAGPYGSTWADQAAITSAFTYSNEQAVSGSWSGKLDYDFSQASGYVLYSTPKLEAIGEKPSALRLQIFGDGSGNKLSFRLYDSTDERFVKDAGVIDWSGWKAFDLTDVEGWQHYLGNDDGVFDAPARQVSVGVTAAAGATVKSALFVDDIHVVYPNAGDTLVADFELATRGLRIWMAAQSGTTLVVGDGLGPDLLAPVPFAMARRQAKESTFLSLLETHGDAPVVTEFASVTTNASTADEALAVKVITPAYQDWLLGLGDGKGGTERTFGEAACDGVLCMVRRDAQGFKRVVLAEGMQVQDGYPLVSSKSVLPALQVDWDAAATRIDLVASVAIQTELRIWGPKVEKVYVAAVDTPYVRDGDYVVLNLAPTADGGVEGGTSDGGSTDGGSADGGGAAGGEAPGGGDGCGCWQVGSARGIDWGALSPIAVLAMALRKRGRSRP